MKSFLLIDDCIRVRACAALLLVPCLASAQVKFHGIGDLPGGAVYSEARDAAKPGGKLIAIGNSSRNPGSSDQFGDTAVQWTLAGGIVALPNLVVNNTSVRFISASAITPDGRIIASRGHGPGNTVGALLVTNHGTTNTYLGTLSGVLSISAANALSDDGSVVYGFSRYSTANGDFQAFRWTAATGMVAVPFPRPGDNGAISGPRCCTPDGRVMVGTSNNLDSGLAIDFTPGNQAFRYVHGVGSSPLPFLPGGTWSYAVGLSADGNLALGVGNSTAVPNGELILWNTRNHQTIALGTPDATFTPNNFGGLTGDGRAAVMSFSDSTGVSFAYARNRHGWTLLHPALQAAGANLTGWVLTSVLGVSRDGTLLFGVGLHNGNGEGWVAEVPAHFLHELGRHDGEDEGDNNDSDLGDDND